MFRKKISLRKKAALFFLGCGFIFFALEAMLQVFSFIACRFFLPRYDFSETSFPDTRIIFCLGDSITYGFGAGFNYSYPAQLEEILNQRTEGTKFRVYNLGVPGYNSTQVAARLRTAVKRCKPDAVIVLCGSTDRWNFQGVRWQWNWGSVLINSVLARLKIFQMADILSQKAHSIIPDFASADAKSGIIHAAGKIDLPAGVKSRAQSLDARKLTAYANVYRDAGYYEQAKIFYEKALFSDPRSRAVLMELGRCYKLNREYEKAAEIFGGILRNNPDDDPIYEELDDIFIRWNTGEKAVVFYKELLKEFPGNEQIARQLSGSYVKMAGRLCVKNKIAAAAVLYAEALKVDPENEQARKMIEAVRVLRQARESDYRLMMQVSRDGLLNLLKGRILFDILSVNAAADDLLNKNLTEIVSLCKEKGIIVILSGYPRKTPEITKQVARRDSIPLVEHSVVFTRLLETASLEAYFISADDPHCTRLGYRVMAENIAEAVLETFLH